MRRRIDRVTLVFGTVALLGLAAALRWIVIPEARPDGPPALAGTDELAPVPVPPPPDQARYDEILARPLFNAGRRPDQTRGQPAPAAAASESAPVAGADADLADYQLVGIVTSQTDQVALVRYKGAVQVLRLTVGGTMGPWAVTAIDSRQVTLGRQGRHETLSFPLVGTGRSSEQASDGGP